MALWSLSLMEATKEEYIKIYIHSHPYIGYERERKYTSSNQDMSFLYGDHHCFFGLGQHIAPAWYFQALAWSVLFWETLEGWSWCLKSFKRIWKVTWNISTATRHCHFGMVAIFAVFGPWWPMAAEWCSKMGVWSMALWSHRREKLMPHVLLLNMKSNLIHLCSN